LQDIIHVDASGAPEEIEISRIATAPSLKTIFEMTGALS
jgi:hypothetical protein